MTDNTAHFTTLTQANNTLSAVFIGGTSGVGEAMVHAFAAYTDGKSNIAIIGRNKAAGERILSQLPNPSKDSEPSSYKRVFIQCDVSLMRNVTSAVQELTLHFPKINYLILSTGFLDLSVTRQETKEGLEYRLAVSYYSRWLFIKSLVGLVENAKQNGEEVAVMSVLAPGFSIDIDQEDWELKKGYSTRKGIYTATTYTDLMVESFAQRHPSVPFIHAHPGLVRTPIFFNSPSYGVKIMGLFVHTIGRLFTISAEQSAESMWSIIVHVSDQKEDEGKSYRMDPKGKNLEKGSSYFGTEEKRNGLWEHTDSAISRSLAVKID